MKTEHKHTPGPWHWCDSLTGYVLLEATPGRPAIVTAAHVKERDARLLASAPDLHEAVRNALHQLTVMREACYGPGDKYIASAVENLRAALAKAEGL